MAKGVKMTYGNRWSGHTKHIVSIGGGTSSTLELPSLVLDKYGAGNVDFVIAALAGESPDLWRMVEWLEQRTGKHVTRVSWTPTKQTVRHGITAQYVVDAPQWRWPDIWDAFEYAGIMGNTRIDPCSRMLKRETLTAFILDHYDPAHTTLHVGITAHEIDRMLAIKRNWRKAGFHVEADLCDVDLQGSSAERAERILGWTPFVYEWGGSHNNCGGFCVKAGHAQMARLLWYAPEIYAYHERREQEFQRAHDTDATIMRDRKTVNGKAISYRLSLRDFRLRMEARWAGMLPGFDPFDALEDTPACTFCSSVA